MNSENIDFANHHISIQGVVGRVSDHDPQSRMLPKYSQIDPGLTPKIKNKHFKASSKIVLEIILG